MKKLFTFLILLIASTAFNFSFADDSEPEPIEIKIPKKKNPINPGIQLKPGYNSGIGFKYVPADRSCEFSFPFDVEYIDIEVENLDTNIIYIGSASVDYPVWHQELPMGEYLITGTADNGDVYEGYVYI